jgi:hypothetical protein
MIEILVSSVLIVFCHHQYDKAQTLGSEMFWRGLTLVIITALLTSVVF